jgi:DNA-binding CsgD family transcriptional regulator/tetratricopeptide (TPR) repeat protein
MPGTGTSRRYIGRERELGQLAAAIAAGSHGRATTVLVAGTAGVGVSRLLDEAIVRAGSSADLPLVLRGRAFGPVDPPWAAVLEAIGPALAGRSVEERLGLLRRDSRALLLELPAMAELGAALPPPAASALEDPERRQPRALEALLRWLGRLSTERPIVMILEDLHTADAATRAFATFIARTAIDERLTLILTYQPDRLTRDRRWRENLAVIEAGLRPPVRIELAPLGRREIAGLIEGIEGERPSASIVVLVAERSAGSPLVVEELVAARRELRSATLNGTLTDIVAARLGQRTHECRRALRLLAPAGRPMERDRLASAAAAFEALAGGRRPPRSAMRPSRPTAGLDGDLSAGLDEALEYGFASTDQHGCVEVRHELIARAIVNDLLPQHLPRFRAALAHAWEDVPAVAALHWRGAARIRDARDAAILAGRRALAVEAPEDALAAFEFGMELPVDQPDSGGSTVELFRLAADAALAAMRPTRAVAYAEAALGALGEHRDRLEYAVLEARLGRYRLAAGDMAGATVALERAAELVPAEPSVERARILALLAQERMIAGAFSDAARHASAALEIAREIGDPAEPEAIHAMTTLAVVRGWGDDAESAVPLLREAIERARALGLVEEWWRAGANMAVVLELLGRPREAIEVAFRDIEEARAMDLDAVYGKLLGGNVAGLLVDVGRWSEARELSLRALDWSPAGVPFVNAILNLVIVEIESEAGEEAGRLLGRILVELETGGDLQFAVPAYQATAAYAMWSGDLADARRAVEHGWTRLEGTEDWVLVARMAATAMEVEAALVEEALDQRRLLDVSTSRIRAAAIFAAAEAAVARAGSEAAGSARREPDASLATARAFLARLRGEDDPGAWADLAARWHELGDPYREAKARWHQAEAILAGAIAGPGGDPRDRTDARVVRADAREPLLCAVDLAIGLRARPLLRALRDLAQRAMIALPPTVEELLAQPAAIAAWPLADVTPSPVVEATMPVSTPGQPARGGDTFGLSRRELEVLNLIAQGRTNREIGDRLFISQKTVGVHVGNILAKLGVSGRVEAAAVAIRLGLESGPARPPRHPS